MVEIFKTDLSDLDEVQKLLSLFETKWNCFNVNVDLDDCDKVLRVESPVESIDPEELISFLALHGFKVIVLE